MPRRGNGKNPICHLNELKAAMNYWGLKAICKRMGWKDLSTPVRQFRDNGFLMYRRRKGKHPKPVWYTNDQLITAWEIAQCKVAREVLLTKEQKFESEVQDQNSSSQIGSERA
jgi:hypothetical protein